MTIVPVFFGLDGRSLSLPVAASAACAIAADGESVSLLAVRAAGETAVFDATWSNASVRILEPRLTTAHDRELDEIVFTELLAGRRVVLAVSAAWLESRALASRPGVRRALLLGASPLDLPLARNLFRRSAHQDGALDDVRIVLGGATSGRSGIETAADCLVRDVGGPASFRLPPFRASTIASILAGAPPAPLIDRMRLLLRALDDGADTGARRHCAPEEPLTPGALLFSLAEDVDAYHAGLVPTEAELASAPLIDEWRATARRVVALEGRIYGHPRIGAGDHGVTTQIFHSDGETYARSFSRLYRLGSISRESSR